MKTLLICLPLVLLACKKDDASKPSVAPPPPGVSRFEIAVTERGFEPRNVAVPAGTPVTLVFDRKTDQTCAKQIVLDMGDGTKLEKELPLDTPVEIATTFPKAGTLGYACAMDMMKGTITVQ